MASSLAGRGTAEPIPPLLGWARAPPGSLLPSPLGLGIGLPRGALGMKVTIPISAPAALRRVAGVGEARALRLLRFYPPILKRSNAKILRRLHYIMSPPLPRQPQEGETGPQCASFPLETSQFLPGLSGRRAAATTLEPLSFRKGPGFLIGDRTLDAHGNGWLLRSSCLAP